MPMPKLTKRAPLSKCRVMGTCFKTLPGTKSVYDNTLASTISGAAALNSGMSGRLAGVTKVVGGGHQASGKVVLPEAIDHHPARERMLDEPIGQLKAAALIRRNGEIAKFEIRNSMRSK